MPFNFPDTPTEGQIFTPPGGPSYTYHTPAWELNADLNDGDKGDVIISDSGTVMLLDPTVVTPAAKSVLDDSTTAQMLSTLGGIGEAPNDGGTYARGSLAWSEIQVPGLGGLSAAEYAYSTTSGLPPSSGQMRADVTTQTAITALYLHEVNALGVDVSNGLRMITSGAKILIQDKTNAANYQIYQVSSTSSDSGTYWTVPVTWQSGGASFTVGRVMIAAFGIGGGAGGVEEAPIDGQEYVRKDGAWEVSTGGGGSGSGFSGTIINTGSFF